MANKNNKFASEFEVKASIDEALKQLQNLTIEGVKLKTSYEEFNKALEKSPKFAGKYYDMLTTIQKQMSSLSKLSEIELVPRKHLNEILDSVSNLQHDLSSLTNISLIDENNIKEAQKIISKIYKNSQKSQEKILNIEEQSKSFLVLEKNLREVLDDVKNIKREFSSIGKESFKNIVEDLDKIQENLYKVQVGGKNSIDEIETLNSKFEDSKKELDLVLRVSQKISGEDKTRNEAARLMFNTSGKIYEVMSRISDTSSSLYNKEISRQFENVHLNVVKINSELEEVVLKGEKQYSSAEAYNKAIRTKMALLKEEQKKLEIIENNYERIKQYERDSISAKVKRAKIENDINTSYAKQILSQKKGLSGILDAGKVLKDNIPNAAMATLGKNGVVAGKAITGAFGALTKIFAPLAALSGLAAIVKTAFDLERQVKASRKQIFMMAMDTNTLKDSFVDLSRGRDIIDTKVEKMSKGFDSINLIGLGINLEQAVQGASDFTKQGFKATEVYENLSDVSGGLFSQSASLGMEIGELAGRAGQLRTEFGYNLGEVSTGFEQIRQDAKSANMSVSIFFDKVLNASVGLALWGQKLDLVSDVFSNLVKNMKLPEAVGAEIASGMAKSLTGLSTEMQIVTYQLGKGKKQWKNYISGQKDANDKRIIAINTEIEAAKAAGKSALVDALKKEKAAKLRDNATLKEYDSLKGLAGMQARIRKMDVGSQLMTQLQAIGGQFGINFEGNIEDVDTRLKNSMFEMEKLGEQFGLDKGAMQGFQQMATNLKLNVQGFREVAKEITGNKDNFNSLIDILGGASRIQNSLKEIIGKDGKVNEKELKKIKEMFPGLENVIDSSIKDGKFDYGKFSESVRTEVSDPQKKNILIQKQIEKILNSTDIEDKKRFAEQLAQNDLLGDYSQQLLEATKSNDPFAIEKVLSGINTSIDLSGKQTKQELDKANVEAAKRAGRAMLQQTKSTEDAINNTIVKILRDGFRWLERLVHMFAWVNKKDLKEFDQVNSVLEGNKKAFNEKVLELGKKESNVENEINRLLGQENGADINKEKIDVLKNLKNSYKNEREKLEEASEKISQDMTKISSKGTIDKEAKEIIKNSQEYLKSTLGQNKSEIFEQQAEGSLGKDYLEAIIGESKKNSLENVKLIDFEKSGTATLNNKQFKEVTKNSESKNIWDWMTGNFDKKTGIKLSNEQISEIEQPFKTQKMLNGSEILSSLNSFGQISTPDSYIPESSNVGKATLSNISQNLSGETSKNPVTTSSLTTGSKIINDNRIININVNQNDRKAVEQVVLNAIYSDKIK